MRKERKDLALGSLLLNEGQLAWLPKNPRQWTQSDIDKTAASIVEDPDFLEDRPLLVVPFDAKLYVVFAGNLRHEGAYAAKRSKVPCVVYYPETDADRETIKRRALKDNGSFGAWDWDEVFSSPWGQMDLEAMGISKAFEQNKEGAVSPDDYGTDFNLPDVEKSRFQQMAFALADAQVSEVKEALRLAMGDETYEAREHFGNENKNGNALALIIEQWLELRTS